jgi:hypothetical protein
VISLTPPPSIVPPLLVALLTLVFLLPLAELMLAIDVATLGGTKSPNDKNIIGRLI